MFCALLFIFLFAGPLLTTSMLVMATLPFIYLLACPISCQKVNSRRHWSFILFYECIRNKVWRVINRNTEEKYLIFTHSPTHRFPRPLWDHFWITLGPSKVSLNTPIDGDLDHPGEGCLKLQFGRIEQKIQNTPCTPAGGGGYKRFANAAAPLSSLREARGIVLYRFIGIGPIQVYRYRCYIGL